MEWLGKAVSICQHLSFSASAPFSSSPHVSLYSRYSIRRQASSSSSILHRQRHSDQQSHPSRPSLVKITLTLDLGLWPLEPGKSLENLSWAQSRGGEGEGGLDFGEFLTKVSCVNAKALTKACETLHRLDDLPLTPTRALDPIFHCLLFASSVSATPVSLPVLKHSPHPASLPHVLCTCCF